MDKLYLFVILIIVYNSWFNTKNHHTNSGDNRGHVDHGDGNVVPLLTMIVDAMVIL